jgi:hypothetical protein
MTLQSIVTYLGESFNLIAPRLLCNNESLSRQMYEFMVRESLASSRLCEGNANLDQPIVAATAYIGIVVFFGNYSFFIDERKIKYVFLWSYYCFGNSLGKISCINRFLYRLCSNV